MSWWKITKSKTPSKTKTKKEKKKSPLERGVSALEKIGSNLTSLWAELRYCDYDDKGLGSQVKRIADQLEGINQGLSSVSSNINLSAANLIDVERRLKEIAEKEMKIVIDDPVVNVTQNHTHQKIIAPPPNIIMDS